MKICGAVLAIFYAGLMLFAVYKEKLKSTSSAFIVIGCVLVFLYTFLNMMLSSTLGAPSLSCIRQIK